jgi:hypothetical protein
MTIKKGFLEGAAVDALSIINLLRHDHRGNPYPIF